MEISSWQATENKNLNPLGEGRAREFGGYGNHKSKWVNQEDRKTQAMGRTLGNPNILRKLIHNL